jgi:hypothetical protein
MFNKTFLSELHSCNGCGSMICYNVGIDSNVPMVVNAGYKYDSDFLGISDQHLL